LADQSGIAKNAANFLYLVLGGAAQLGAVAFFAWRFHIHTAIVVILTAGVVVTWFIPPRLVLLCIGITLLAGAVANDVLNVTSQIGYTAAGLTVVTGAIVALRQ